MNLNSHSNLKGVKSLLAPGFKRVKKELGEKTHELFSNIKITERWKNAIFCEGKITSQWRHENNKRTETETLFVKGIIYNDRVYLEAGKWTKETSTEYLYEEWIS